MQNDLITKLNTLIVQIDSDTIRKHIEAGDLDEWLSEWKIEMSSVSFGLFMALVR